MGSLLNSPYPSGGRWSVWFACFPCKTKQSLESHEGRQQVNMDKKRQGWSVDKSRVNIRDTGTEYTAAIVWS